MKRGSDIKPALCALCRVLSFCGSEFDAETLRKAKFNRPEAASGVWKLLYCLLKQIYSGNDLSSISRDEKGIKGFAVHGQRALAACAVCWPCDLAGDVTVDQNPEMHGESWHEIRYVKSILQIQGYGRPAFYELPDDGSEGSRETLLAFSWLLYTGRILERILEKKRVQLGDYLTFSMVYYMLSAKVHNFIKNMDNAAGISSASGNPKQQILEFLPVLTKAGLAALQPAKIQITLLGSSLAAQVTAGSASLEPKPAMHATSPCPQNMNFTAVKDLRKSTKQDVDVRYLQWLNGRLQLCWRKLHTVHLEKCSMLYKIHSYTQGRQIGQSAHHLSAMEIELVRHPEICNMLKLLQYLESENSYLEAYLEWRHLEAVYWQWMVTILIFSLPEQAYRSETVFQSAAEDECITLAQNEIKLYTSFPREVKPQSNLVNIKALHKSFSDVHDQFHDLVKQRKHSWHDQIKELERYVKGKESSLLIKQIKQEVGKKTEHLKHQHEEVSNANGLLKLVFKESKFKDEIHEDFNMKNVRATNLITMLQTAATKLEAEFQNLQDKSREKFDVMTGELEGIVCIPPAKC
ncbi:PREDICTED: uncharacterized protein C14orf80 homolog [Nanorana parkeri]|uniref:uncharacterized protein C14orf80 homolog n=1 Tax=Nanorana parkeri TaxID=125878 RepID=UPI000853FEF1|nr:PREDICTED: uncharacterized protein C14orf80 homolog [Nanorana parkeri]